MICRGFPPGRISGCGWPTRRRARRGAIIFCGTIRPSGGAIAPPARLEDDRPFVVKLARSGGDYAVPPGETILDVLRRQGVETRSSCELGYCGACLTKYLGGEVDHRDPILNEAARQTHL